MNLLYSPNAFSGRNNEAGCEVDMMGPVGRHESPRWSSHLGNIGLMSDYRFGGCDGHHERVEFELLAGISSDLMRSPWTNAL